MIRLRGRLNSGQDLNFHLETRVLRTLQWSVSILDHLLSPAHVRTALYVLQQFLLGPLILPSQAFIIFFPHGVSDPWVERCSHKTLLVIFYHVSGCFRQPPFSCSLLLKYINAWCHRSWLIKLPLWVTAARLRGNWHPELRAGFLKRQISYVTWCQGLILAPKTRGHRRDDASVLA